MIFFELRRYADFDIPITHSMWYKEILSDQEILYMERGVLLDKMLEEFKNLSGEEFKMDGDSIYCGIAEMQVLKAFKDYLGARGYKRVKSNMTLQFTSENLEEWDGME